MELADLLDDSTAAATVAYLKRTTSGDKCPCCCVRKYVVTTNVYVVFAQDSSDPGQSNRYLHVSNIVTEGNLDLHGNGTIMRIPGDALALCKMRIEGHTLKVDTISGESSSGGVCEVNVSAAEFDAKDNIKERTFSTECFDRIPCDHTIYLSEDIEISAEIEFELSSTTMFNGCGEDGHESAGVAGYNTYTEKRRTTEIVLHQGYLTARLPVKGVPPSKYGIEGEYRPSELCCWVVVSQAYECKELTGAPQGDMTFQFVLEGGLPGCASTLGVGYEVYYKRTDCSPPVPSSSSTPCVRIINIHSTVYVMFGSDISTASLEELADYSTSISIPEQQETGLIAETIPELLFGQKVCSAYVKDVKLNVVDGYRDCIHTEGEISFSPEGDGRITQHEIQIDTSCFPCGVTTTIEEKIYIDALVDIRFHGYSVCQWCDTSCQSFRCDENSSVYTSDMYRDADKTVYFTIPICLALAEGRYACTYDERTGVGDTTLADIDFEEKTANTLKAWDIFNFCDLYVQFQYLGIVDGIPSHEKTMEMTVTKPLGKTKSESETVSLIDCEGCQFDASGEVTLVISDRRLTVKVTSTFGNYKYEGDSSDDDASAGQGISYPFSVTLHGCEEMQANVIVTGPAGIEGYVKFKAEITEEHQ